MQVELHPVAGHLKQHEMFYARANDFERGPPVAVSDKILREEPGWSPYCVDHEQGVVSFVRLPPGTDLSQAAFWYVTQYRAATHILDLPLAGLTPLAEDLPDPRLALIFSMGRCGTTLASHAFNGSPRAWSLSEPEVFNHRALQVPAGSPVAPGDMVRALVRLIFATRSRRSADTLVVKLRSQSLYHMRPFTAGRPDAAYVFMYRDALSWAESVHQFMVDVNFRLPMDEEERLRGWKFFSGDGPLADLAPYADLAAPFVEADVMLAAGWIAHLQAYLRELDAGVPFLALRYNELVADRQAGLVRLFAHCGLPPDGIGRALGAFDEDSQKDTTVSRRADRQRLTDGNRAAIRSTLGRNPAFADPDLILPDAYAPLDERTRWLGAGEIRPLPQVP